MTTYDAIVVDDNQVFVIVYWPNAEFHRVRSDIEASFMGALELADSPTGSERAHAASASAAPARCRTSTAVPTGTGGPWWEMPVTTRTQSRRSA